MTAEDPDLSLTWEMRGSSLVLVGYDDGTVETTRNLIQGFIGGSAEDLYKDRKDIVSDLETCFRDRTVLRRRTIYRFFTTGEERVAEITYAFVHPNLVIMYLEDYTERDAAEALNRSFVRGSPAGLCLTQNGRIRFANPKLWN